MTEQQHTPTPWKQGTRHPAIIMGAEGFVATACRHSSDEAEPDAAERANAAFIVRACNSHQALVDLAEMVEHAADNGGHPINGKDVGALLKAARAALALAKKEA